VSSVAAIRAAVAAALARHGRRRVDVAFSGGPDSSVLADAAAAALGPAAVRLLHVDHGAPASAAAVVHARAWAAARGLAIAVAAVEVPAGPSWEAQARRVRHRALVELAAGELIFTGHTATDQAETVLLRLLRGTGPDGLAAIAPRRGPFVRPLLAHGRAAVLAYCEAEQLAPWRDPMNADPRYARAWLRQTIVPALAARHPQLEGALVALAADAADDRALFAPQVATARAAVARGDDLDAAALAALPPALARRVVAAWLTTRGRGATRAHVGAVLDLAARPTAGSRGLDLPGGRVERIYDRLIAPARAEGAAPPPPLLALGPDGPYRIRAWQPGDRMRPARLRGRSRKLSDLYADAKVPRAARAGARVVLAVDGTIVWAEHLGAAWQVEIAVR
jgi:tRNA(Ile)-lysidine synthase